jgi:hypothetical protein
MRLAARKRISFTWKNGLVIVAIFSLAACGGLGDTTLPTPTTAAPTISSISPSSGPTVGGTLVTIIGSNFQDGATVSFGQVAATNVKFNSSTRLEATTPAESAGLVDVTVTNPHGQPVVHMDAFTFTTPAPMISTIAPTSGSTNGGTLVTIIGSNFQDGATVSFGQVAATNVKFNSSTRLEATTPAESASLVDVTVTNPDGQSAVHRGGFTFVFHAITLAWTPSTSTVKGYNIYRAKVSGGPYSKLNPSAITGTTYTDNAVQGGTKYFYVAAALNSNDVESVYSNEVSATVPEP